MADYGRRRRRGKEPSGGGEDFNWEEYDRMTSEDGYGSPYGGVNGGYEPSPRRVHQSVSSRKKAAAKKQERRQKNARSRRIRKRIRLVMFAVLFICIVIVTGISIGMYAAVSREIKDMNIQNLALNYSSFIYYPNENGEMEELQQIQSTSNRIWVDSSQISQYAKDAIVAIEDERFYGHHGVDLKRTFGATVKYALSKLGWGSSDYGGSTITQQVIKNITNENEKTSARKIKEMMRAIALERELSKDEILTMYLNIVYFSNNCYGIEAAANTYFNKDALDLNLQEAASIAGITQYPSEYDPYQHPEKNIEKRNIVLEKMLELGKISQSQYNEAANSDLILDKSFRRAQAQITSYFVDQVITDVIEDLQSQKGYSEDFAIQQVYNGGLKIYSTIDREIQEIMEDVFTDTSNFPRTGKGGQSAMVIIDPYSGQIKGLVGGLGEKTDIRGWNRATQAKRQPGSAIKPLSVYAPAIDMGKITEATVLTDEEITIGDDEWKPRNSYKDFYGDMPVKEAVARSSNIPAVKVLDEVGISSSFGFLQNKFHLTTLSEEDKNYSSLSLGGLTEGVTVEEICGAYATFVNSGKYIKPHTYSQVIDAAGQVILSNSDQGSQAISAASAFITSDLLYAVVNSRVGTGTRAKLEDMPTYGKTGTTDDDCDKWFVGFTPYYVGAVWYGFDNPSSISAAGVGGNPSVTAWQLVMSRVHEGLSEKELEKPANIAQVSVCTASSMLATTTCPADTCFFIEGTQPKSMCNAAHASSRKLGAQEESSGKSSLSSTSSPSASSSPTGASDRETAESAEKASTDNSSQSGSSQGSSSQGSSSQGSSSQGSSSQSGSSQSSSSQGGSSQSGSSQSSSSSSGSSQGSSSQGSSYEGSAGSSSQSSSYDDSDSSSSGSSSSGGGYVDSDGYGGSINLDDSE